MIYFNDKMCHNLVSPDQIINKYVFFYKVENAIKDGTLYSYNKICIFSENFILHK